MATHSSILAWRTSWTEEPGGLQSVGSQRVGHDWMTNTHTCICVCVCVCVCVYIYIYVCIFMCVKLLQSYLTICNPVDCSPPGPSVHEVLQARILEWVAIPFSRGSSQLRD